MLNEMFLKAFEAEETLNNLIVDYSSWLKYYNKTYKNLRDLFLTTREYEVSKLADRLGNSLINGYVECESDSDLSKLEELRAKIKEDIEISEFIGKLYKIKFAAGLIEYDEIKETLGKSRKLVVN